MRVSVSLLGRVQKREIMISTSIKKRLMEKSEEEQKCAQVSTHYKFMSLCGFNPEELLIGREGLGDEPYTCLICHQLLRYPVHCQKCNSEYCMSCAARWQDTNNTCPLRCSSPWVLEESFCKNLQLKCPLGKTCKPLSPETFERHLQDCLRNRLIENYQCREQHPLSYMTVPKRIGCADCGKNSLTRSICFECMNLGQTFLYYYCEKCRMPRFTKKNCPAEHEFVHMIPKGGFTCVGCRQTSSKKQRCYRDEGCKMAFCVGCYSKLPDRICENQTY